MTSESFREDSARLEPVPAGCVLLHVGVHKTGTTALQTTLAHKRSDLRDRGVLYPGNGKYHHRSMLAFLERPFGWRKKGAFTYERVYWDKLKKEATSFPEGRTIISSELLDDIDAEVARELVDELGGPGRVEVVISLRSLASILPSVWQQTVKSGARSRFEDWLELVFAEPRRRAVARFWKRHDHADQVSRWAQVVGPQGVHVIIVREGDRLAVPRAFAQLLDLPDDFLAADGTASGNRSMTAPEAEFIRQLNESVVDDLDWPTYYRQIRQGLTRSMVEDRVPGAQEPGIATPEWARKKAHERDEEFADKIDAMDVHVVGSTATLRDGGAQIADDTASAEATTPTDVPIEAATIAVKGLLAVGFPAKSRKKSVATSTAPDLGLFARAKRRARATLHSDGS
ncbi:MAG: hypothetical protein U0990_11285 [Candidatus Nanopelagicales bacterium]|nr:hypothetical protein [Candidatus Nanopelagicales bacterium]MDZ4250651.1 hypothetical protein [Candidatus Nanopelagicales bacterium]